MTLSDRIQQLINQNNTSQSELEKTLGFGKGTITKWKGSTAPSADKLLKIANHFGVTIDYLMTGTTGNNACSPCPDCGFSYDPNNKEDVESHTRRHAAWKKAVEKFGTLYCDYPEREQIKALNRAKSHDTSLTLDERCEAQIYVLRCLFSRSLIASSFNLNHVNFDTYVSMMLNNPVYIKDNIESDLLAELIARYGTAPGINIGTIYKVPYEQSNTLAAHFDGDEYSEDELEEIRQFAEFVKNKRKQ